MLCQAAMRLALERGVEHVTAEAIAAEANVSPRTFHNYFSSKEEAIVAAHFEGAHGLLESLRARPRDESVWTSLEVCAQELIDRLRGDASPDNLRRMFKELHTIKTHPALTAQHLNALHDLTRRLAEEVASRTGTDLDRDLYPRLLCAAVGAAFMAVTDMWVHGQTDRDLHDLLKEAFALLQAGLPIPSGMDTQPAAPSVPSAPSHSTGGSAVTPAYCEPDATARSVSPPPDIDSSRDATDQ